MKRPFGKCALCGEECELTFEHIPPKKAFNSAPARPVSVSHIVKDNNRMPWDTSGLPYTNQQQGFGKYSLCEKCNNDTGTWYGDAYVEFVHIAHDIISRVPSSSNGAVRIKDIYPLRFIKQVISMFCSINDADNPTMADLREFVLDKNASGLNKSKYKICMYFTNSEIMKCAPLSILVFTNKSALEFVSVSEITARPLGFILYFNPAVNLKCDGIDITCFADCKYDEKADVMIPWRVNEVNDVFPTMYRTKREIIQCIEENKEWEENYECTDN